MLFRSKGIELGNAVPPPVSVAAAAAAAAAAIGASADAGAGAGGATPAGAKGGKGRGGAAAAAAADEGVQAAARLERMRQRDQARADDFVKVQEDGLAAADGGAGAGAGGAAGSGSAAAAGGSSGGAGAGAGVGGGPNTAVSGSAVNGDAAYDAHFNDDDRPYLVQAGPNKPAHPAAWVQRALRPLNPVYLGPLQWLQQRQRLEAAAEAAPQWPRPWAWAAAEGSTAQKMRALLAHPEQQHQRQQPLQPEQQTEKAAQDVPGAGDAVSASVVAVAASGNAMTDG